MQKHGRVKKYFYDSGYGFVTTEKGDLFFHIKSCVDRECERRLVPGVAVEFDIAEGRKGLEAVNVVISEAA